MEKVSTYTPSNPVFFKPETLIPNDVRKEIVGDIHDFFTETSRPENPMKVDRYMDVIELGELDLLILDTVKTARPLVIEKMQEAEAALQQIKTMHKNIKAEVDAMDRKISDMVEEYRAGIKSVTVEPEKTYRAYKRGYMYFYTEIEGVLKLVSFREANEKEKNAFEGGMLPIDNENEATGTVQE